MNTTIFLREKRIIENNSLEIIERKDEDFGTLSRTHYLLKMKKPSGEM